MALADVIGKIPYRMAFAGGWIDQPFVSRFNPNPPGSMVVVSIEPNVRFMDRAGMATGTRKIANKLWHGQLPNRNPDQLVRELYATENAGQADPSGSQDMIGMIYPGISRLDYDISYQNGVFPRHIESTNDPKIAAWIERVIHMIPVGPRPPGYHPLEKKNIDPTVVAELGQTGRDCYDALLACDIKGLGQSMNRCMKCWDSLLPFTMRHRTIELDLYGLLAHYQQQYAGAMYSGCGGGYLYVASDEPVPGGFKVKVRLA